MFRCKDIAEHASRYVDRSLPFTERMKYQLHLLICHHCRKFIAQFKLSIRSIRKVAPRAPTEAAVATQLAALQKARAQLEAERPEP